MRSSRIGRGLAIVGAVGVMLLVQAAPDKLPERELAAHFHTEVPAHPNDIILGRPTSTSVTASVLSYAAVEGYMEWGTETGKYAAKTEPVKLAAGEPVEIVMGGLAADTQYFYRLRTRAGTGDFAAGEEHRFHTQRPPGSKFTFTIQADSHLDERAEPEMYLVTLKNAMAEGPDFHVDLGDTFMSDKVRAMKLPAAGMYLAQRYYLGMMCASAPLFFVTGNHDGEIGGQDPEAVGLRIKYLPNPLPGDTKPGDGAAPKGNYYAWEWGDALFVVLDPFTFTTARIKTADDNWNRTLGETQYRWLERVLEGSKAKLKFVFIHNLVGGLDRDGRGGIEAAPYFEWGGKSLNGANDFDKRRPGWGLPIHQLLVKCGVSAVFHGHDHLYANQELDGIVYQEVPQPGWVGGEQVNQAADYGYASGRIMASSGHLRVRVAADGATVTYVRSRLPEEERFGIANGAVGDFYRILPATP
jgi:hypothetical protein